MFRVLLKVLSDTSNACNLSTDILQYILPLEVRALKVVYIGKRRELADMETLIHRSYRQALDHCESLDSFCSSRSGEKPISEDEVASQVR